MLSFMVILPLQSGQISIIQSLAERIWPEVFREILSPDQISYMMDMMYSTKSLENQLGVLDHQFRLVLEEPFPIGYFSYQLDYPEPSKLKIHKLYLDPTTRNKGYGKKVIQEISSIADLYEQKDLQLNVNRHNTAIKFYEKLGFQKIREEQIAIGNGYIMDDWVMELSIHR